jgi:adenine-specific DNA-methyltransferase
MVDWLLGNPRLNTMLEPAFGLGVFSRILLEKKKKIKITSFDIDPVISAIAKGNFSDSPNVELLIEDYLFNDWENKYDAVVCNPPYLKFHDYDNKKTLNEIRCKLKVNLSGFTNIYTLFLLKSIYQLSDNGRLAYIVPSEFFNSDYGTYVKDYLLQSNALRHIIVFDFNENVFGDALTTSTIILLAKDDNFGQVHFTTVKKVDDLSKISNVINNYPAKKGSLSINTESMDPKIKWRAYYQKQQSLSYKELIPFNSVAKVVRGIATGANDYFTFNSDKAKRYKIGREYLLPCITRSKDVNESFFTNNDLSKLRSSGANVFLFNGRNGLNDINVCNYIKLGEKSGIDAKYLTSKRNPWYAIENRPPAPIWVGVFSRAGLKFIRNEAGIYNLTAFHCIYLSQNMFCSIKADLLFAYLLTDTAMQIFSDNRREYGNGLKKFEPNDLNNALILDLSKLNNEREQEILNLFFEYRYSIVNSNKDFSIIQEIDNIFKEEYMI